MNRIGQILLSFDTWLFVGPPLIAALGFAATLHMSKLKWVVHVLVLASIFFLIPGYFLIGEVDDGPPGPMNGVDGLILLGYISYAAVFGIAYAGYAFMTRTRPQAQVSSTMSIDEAGGLKDAG